jgi:hypothetical protein
MLRVGGCRRGEELRQLRRDGAVVHARAPGAQPSLDPQSLRELGVDAQVDAIPVLDLLPERVRERDEVVGRHAKLRGFQIVEPAELIPPPPGSWLFTGTVMQ